MCDTKNDEEDDENIVDGFITHNPISNNYLDNRNDVGTPLSSNEIKYVTKLWKQNMF